jgi:Overcoming lysogenization defect protein-like, TOPRIM domain
MNVGTDAATQSTIRVYPDAFLAPSVLVCEGASEVGLLRGLDQHFTARGKTSLSAHGVALVDCTGADSDRPYRRGDAFLTLGYRVAVLRDDDKKPTPGVEKAFTDADGVSFSWRKDRALEDELFISLSDSAVGKMLDYAIDLHGEALIDDHIKSASNGAKTLNAVRTELLLGNLPAETRIILGKAARTRKAGWLKSVSWMEQVAREIVGPELSGAKEGFRAIITGLFAWISYG